jgi:glucose/arabinose dehydrogenase
MSLPSVIISAASNLIDTAMESILSSNPNAPTDSPLLWGVLGWVRRQFSAALGDDTPTVGLAQTSLVTAQAVDAQAELPEDLERIVLASGINQPTDLRFLPDGGILIVEKGGAIKVFQNGQIQDQPLLTVTTRTEGERGLTAIEVDPDFRTNHYVYIAYTGADDHERLSRLTVTGYTGDPTTEVLSIDPDSEHILLASDQMAANFHQGGGLLFGPDKMLYWSLGDNFFAPNSQNLATLQGKILRLDPYHLDANGIATAPVGNPFINTAGANPLIYAYGFRNPFRFTFAPDGTLLEADVGGAAWEEVNVVKAGANYGWPLAEGVCDNCGFVNPIYAYPHSPLPELAGSITGITFYTGDALGDAYKNKVFIADYSLGFIRELTFDDKFTSLISERTIDEHAGTPVLLMQGPDGFIYQMNYAEGELLVIRPSGGNKAPTAVVTATPNFGKPAPLSIDFSSQGSTDPEGATLSYSWEFGDNATSTDQNPTHIYSSNGIYVAMLTVSDGEKTATASQQIFVGNTAPVVEITTPVDESKYNAGTTITFSGSATDGEDATLPDSAFTWTVIFHHSEHIHPFADNLVGRSGSIEIPTDPSQLSNTWYEIKLTVTDSQGLSSTKSVEIRPNLVSLAYGANNPDVIYTIDGIPHKGDYSELGVVGVQHVIGAVSPQTVGDKQMAFSRWSDGGAQQHTVTTPTTDASYSVSFDTLIPHAEFVPGAILKALQQNISSTVAMLGNAFKASTSAVVDAAAGLPATLLGAVRNAVQHPTHLPSIVAGLVTDLVGDVNGVVSPLVSAATDVIVTTAKRAVGTGFALVNNVVPIARALVDAPGEVGSAIKDSADLLFGFLRKLDILGIVGSLQYAQLTIGNEFSHQIDNIVGSVADLQSDILDALSAD